MKQICLLVSVFFLSNISYGQEEEKTRGFFYKISMAGTLTMNENYTIQTDDDERLVKLNGFFINNTFGLQVDERVSIGLNAEIDFYERQQLKFTPIYISARYNLIVDDLNYFVRGGIGRLIKLGKHYENGTLYKLGLGLQLFDKNFRNSLLIGVDFSRKRFGFKEQEKLSSMAIFIEYQIF